MRRIIRKKYPCVVLNQMAVLPGMVIHFDINGRSQVKAVEKAMVKDRKLFCVAEKSDGEDSKSQKGSLYAYGCVVTIKQVVRLPGNVLRVLVEGEMRSRLFDVTKDECLIATAKEVVPVDDTPSLLMKGVRFESKPASISIKADCELEIDLHNLGPGRVTEMMLHVRIIEKGPTNYLLAEEYFSLNTLQEGELRTEKLSLKSLIKENCILEVELTGAEVEPLFYTLGLRYSQINGY